MWQQVYGDPTFRFRTNDPVVNKRLRQRKDFELAVKALNERMWVYVSSFYSPQKARQTLTRITRQKIEKTSNTGEFVAETYPIVAPQNEPESR